jgi:hypothetical protein
MCTVWPYRWGRAAELANPRRVALILIIPVALTGLAKFPANREINREFCRLRPCIALFGGLEASEFNGLLLKVPVQQNTEFSYAY